MAMVVNDERQACQMNTPVSRRNQTLGFIGQFEQCSGREKYGYKKLEICRLYII